MYFYEAPNLKALTDSLTQSDKELLLLVSEGDEPAFQQLFLSYIPRLRPLIISIIKTDLFVKDIIQEIFLHLWINRERLKEVESPEQWILKMTYNRCFSLLRKQAVRRSYAVAAANSTMADDPDWYSFEETARLLRQAVNTLSPQAKKIYLMKEAGLGLKEISGELGISVQSVKNAQYRSMQQIRSFMIEKGVFIPVFLLLWQD